jgi:hypothetical protein
MEEGQEVYARPYNENRPVVCMDEKPYQLLEDAREPLPLKPGHTGKVDSVSLRNGTCSVFVFTEPLGGWRHVEALPQRTKKDWAHKIRWLLDTEYPAAEKVVPVMDNLNTHALSSLYETFSPEEARRIRDKPEIHYTPKHGSSSEHGRDRDKCSGESRTVRTYTDDAANGK